MYFVTVGRKGYVLFSKTPSEKAAIGLTEQQIVHLLRRGDGPDDWKLLAEWDANELSHTDFMSAMHHRSEPADPEDLLDILPPELRKKLRT